MVGEGSLGFPSAARELYPERSFRLFLWHFCQDLMRGVKGGEGVGSEKAYAGILGCIKCSNTGGMLRSLCDFLLLLNRVHPSVEVLFDRYEKDFVSFLSLSRGLSASVVYAESCKGLFSTSQGFSQALSRLEMKRK